MDTSKPSRPSPAMIVAVVALVFAMIGTAVAGTGAVDKLTKSSVKKIAKKQADKELKANVAGSHVNTADNATNATNATNAVNAAQLGGSPAASYNQYGAPIPSGTKLVGGWRITDDADAVADDRFETIEFPGKLPATLSFTQVNFAAGTPGGSDNDATCTGTLNDPTAPPGKACIYLDEKSNVSAEAGFQTSTTVANNIFGFTIRVTATGVGQLNASGTWAYTAP